jgi:hypothetical protein
VATTTAKKVRAPRKDEAVTHHNRQEIARYLLSRGLDTETLAPSAARLDAATAAPPKAIPFPDGLAPVRIPLDPVPAPDATLPPADVVVITWTVDELAGLARVFCPGHSPSGWAKYTHNYDKFAPKIRPHAPARTSQRLASYQPVKVGNLTVLCMKSELHLNQDGIKTGDGTATLPVKDLFLQIIAEAKPRYFFTVGTAGSVVDDFQLGDVVVTRAARFVCNSEFKNEPFNNTVYKNTWKIPTGQLPVAQQLMAGFAQEIVEPPFGPPTTHFAFKGPLLNSSPNTPDIKLEQGARDMPAFHPILTTDYFEYGTSTNGLGKLGSGVEMGDAALGLACSQLSDPPDWAVVRNMSDPVINGALPAKQFNLNEQTTWAVGYYTAYGKYTSICGALATWAVIAGLEK